MLWSSFSRGPVARVGNQVLIDPRAGRSVASDGTQYVLAMNRERGTVKWFSREKGWGFLRRENGDEIFVHHSDIEGEGHVSLEDEEEVEFGVEEMEKGPRAREVRRPGQAPAAKSARTTSSTAADRGVDERGSRSAEPPTAPSGSDESGGGPPPLDRGLRQRLGDRFPIFRDR